jgi:TolB-like protein
MWRTRMKAGQPCMVMPFCNSSTQENQETLSLKKKKK